MEVNVTTLAEDPTLGKIESITLKGNTETTCVKILTFGAVISNLVLPDGHGRCDDVVLGFDTWSDYKTNNAYIGAVCGRFANRIKNAQFALDGETYTLAVNNGPNSLHGGAVGFSHKNWALENTASDENSASVTLSYFSPDGEENYPGNLKVTVTYTFTAENVLRIAYTAESDKNTVLNLTNHTYFNLKGEGEGNILGHFLQMDATHYLELDADCCPTGKVLPVANTPFDFRKVHDIGFRIYEDNPQLKHGKGYDTNFCYKHTPGELKRVATVYESATRRRVDVYTDLPGIQVYTGNWLGRIDGKSLYHDYEGVALETQNWPAAPNFRDFPSAELLAGEHYTSVTEYRFSTM